MRNPHDAAHASSARGDSPSGRQQESSILTGPLFVRRQWVRDAFHAVAGRYDLANHLLSAGVHLWWKRTAVEAMLLRPGDIGVDVCCGTADLLLGMSRRVGARGRAVGVDFAPGMLAVASRRVRHAHAPVHLVCADAEALPLATDLVDAVTFAFGLRNVAHPAQALEEAHRVLRPGGRLVILEFGRPRRAAVRMLYDLYSRMIIPRLGGWLSGRPDAYRYLHDSIRQWTDPNSLATLIRDQGFEDVHYHLLTGGIAVLHTAVRP